MDRGTWPATFRRVTKSWTLLKWLNIYPHIYLLPKFNRFNQDFATLHLFSFFFINSKEDFIICFFGCTESWVWNVGSSFFTEAWGIFPDKGCNLRPLHWELRVLATRPPWKLLRFYYLKSRRFREESRGLYFGVGQRSWSFLFCFCLCLVT